MNTRPHSPVDTSANQPQASDGAGGRAANGAPTRHERALAIAGEHLRRASLSLTRAHALEGQGLHQQAREHSRMSRVFIHNALHHLQTHAPDGD